MTVSAYERDFYAWLGETIEQVREGRFDGIDRDILIDELESMGKRDKRELLSRFVILIAHLLKWRYQPQVRSPGWVGSIAEQRLQTQGQLDDSPSLEALIQQSVVSGYPKAVQLAAKETDLTGTVFPAICPFSVDELLDEDFYPET